MNRSAVLITLATLTTLAGFGCGKSKDTTAAATPAKVAPAIAVQTGTVELRDMPKIVTLLGNVAADRQSEVAANVAGRVVLTPIERGQSVKAGEALVIVDSRAANLSASAATAQAELAATQSSQAAADCERAERLHAQGAMGQAEFDRQHTQCKAQQFQASAARAQAGLSSKLAADATVRAPFSGVIGERYVNAGEYVQPHTRIASMYTLDPVRITVSVPERGVSLVRTGVNLDIEVAAWPGRVFPATVEFVSPALRTMQRDLLIEARAANPDGALRPGMFATVQVSVGDEKLATVPFDAIRTDGDVRRLFLARDGHAFEMVVRTGVTRDGRIAVYEDLAADTLVIRQPSAELRDGALITVTSPTHAAVAQPTADQH